MEPRACQDCKEQFIPRASYAVRCMPCWRAWKDGVQAASPVRNPAGIAAGVQGRSPVQPPASEAASNLTLSPSRQKPGNDGDTTFAFGKQKGKTFSYVFSNDKSYVNWARKQDSPSGSLLQFLEFAAAQTTITSNARDRSRTPRRHSLPSSSGSPAPGATPTSPTAGSAAIVGGAAQLLSQGSAAGIASGAAVSPPPSPPPTPPASPRGAGEDGAGSTTFSFGKHKGRTFADIFSNEKGYVSWARKLPDVTNEQMLQFIDFIGANGAQAQRPRSRSPRRQSTGSASSAAVEIRVPPTGSAQAPLAPSAPAQAAVSDSEPLDGDSTLIDFGRYSGRTFKSIYATEKGYVDWVRKLENTSGRMAELREYFLLCSSAVRRKQYADAKKAAELAQEQRAEQQKVAREKRSAEDDMRRSAEELAREKKAEERERLAHEREERRIVAGAELQKFLQSKFEEYKSGYPNLQHFDQLSTGHDPFGEIIRLHGDKWMQVADHAHYRKQETWDPRKILEWGQTYIEKYAPGAEPQAIDVQKAAIELMLTQCCLLVKPNVERKIYWELQDKHKAFSRDIKRVFGKIFEDLQKRAEGKVASAEPPRNVAKAKPEAFFGKDFTWSWEWPVSVHVAIACKYYMWKRSDCETAKESEEAGDRRILLIQMLLKFKAQGDVEAFPNGDGSDILYCVSGGSSAILVEAPDNGAVHVFVRPAGITNEQHRVRIFALFRHFNSLITQKGKREDGKHSYAKVGDVEELPEEFVASALSAKSKAHKNYAVLDAHPEIKAELTVQPASKRQTLQEFVGWESIITHRKQELTKAAFHEALGIAEKRAKAVEGKTINEIKAARRTAGETRVEFHGGSWH